MRVHRITVSSYRCCEGTFALVRGRFRVRRAKIQAEARSTSWPNFCMSAGMTSMMPPDAARKAVRLLARTMMRDLHEMGYSEQDMIHFASAMLEEVANTVRKRRSAA